jgi:hypothetical protein
MGGPGRPTGQPRWGVGVASVSSGAGFALGSGAIPGSDLHAPAAVTDSAMARIVDECPMCFMDASCRLRYSSTERWFPKVVTGINV